MKAVIAILAIVGLAFTAWHYQQKSHSLADTISDLGTEARASKKEIDGLEKEVARLEKELLAAKAAIPDPAVTVTTKPKESPTVTPARTTTAPTATPDDRAAKIAAIEAEFARQKAAMDARQTEIDAARIRAQGFIAQAEAARPQFSEQSARFDNAGIQIGNKGVRTSQADREKAMAKWSEQLAAAQAGLVKVDEEQAKLNAARDAAARAFDAAMEAVGR